MTDTHDQTHEAFDLAAPRYDDSFEALPGVKRLRSVVHSCLLKYFKSGHHILELNCGTGTDATALARRGIRVHATDASKPMVTVAAGKIAASGLDHMVTTEVLPFEDLLSLQHNAYDGAFSNLGGLNCISQLDGIAHSLAILVRPSGFVVVVIMPDFSLWEMLAFGLRGDFGNAFHRRRSGGVIVSVHGRNVRTHYHGPREVRKAFEPSFRHIHTIGLNVITPPPSSIHAYRTLGKWRRMLEKMEDACASHFPFNRIGDHYLMVLQRVEDKRIAG